MPTSVMELQPTILVVEDHPLIAMDLADELSDLGYQVLGPFATVGAARKVLSITTPDAACLDVKLEDGFSFAFARELLDMGIRTTFLTGQGTLTRLNGVEGADVLDKPLAAQKLREHFAIIKSSVGASRR